MAYTKDIGLRDFYKQYVERAEKYNKPYVTYSIYAKLLKELNKSIRNKILYNSETLVMPYQLGELNIHKFETVYTEDNVGSWRVDYKATKEAGKPIYYGAQYGYKWKWNKQRIRLNGKKWYSFKPCRAASRLIADAVNNKQLDFYN